MKEVGGIGEELARIIVNFFSTVENVETVPGDPDAVNSERP